MANSSQILKRDRACPRNPFFVCYFLTPDVRDPSKERSLSIPLFCASSYISPSWLHISNFATHCVQVRQHCVHSVACAFVSTHMANSSYAIPNCQMIDVHYEMQCSCSSGRRDQALARISASLVPLTVPTNRPNQIFVFQKSSILLVFSTLYKPLCIIFGILCKYI